jgi:hypothetical protein
LRSCPRFISRYQISDVPPTATMNAVIPLVIVSCVQGPGKNLWYLRTAIGRSVPFSSPLEAWPFIDHSTEIWNFCRDKT